MTEIDKVKAKIMNLLKLAEDGQDDEESHTALLMAQKLMLKHKLSHHQLHQVDAEQIIIKSLSVYKRIYWWEKILARIIADNFHVMFYLQSNRFEHQQAVRRKIVFMGYEEEVRLAIDMFHFAEINMKHFAQLHLKMQPNERLNTGLRKSYYQGFLDGLNDKFEAQKQAMIKENEQYALVMQVPQALKDAFNAQVNGQVIFKTPYSNKATEAYHDGFAKGKQLVMVDKYLPQ